MRRGISRGAFTAAAASAFANIAIVRKPASAAAYSWKWSFDLGPDHPIYKRMGEAFEKIQRDAKGEIEIKMFPNSVLGGIDRVVSQTRSGAIEMSMQPGGLFDSIVPIASVENLAYIYPDRKSVFAAFDGEVGAMIRDQAQAKGMILLDKIFENGWRDFQSTKGPIRTVADLDGFKLRVTPSKIRFDTFRSLGAAVTPIASNELYTALQTHIVDGMESSIGVVESLRLYEVQKYLSRSHHMWSGYWVMINPDKWASLPASFQEIMRRRINEAAILERKDNDADDKAIQEKLHSQGMEVNFPPPDTFKAKLVASGYYGRWKETFGDQLWTALLKYVPKVG